MKKIYILALILLLKASLTMAQQLPAYHYTIADNVALENMVVNNPGEVVQQLTGNSQDDFVSGALDLTFNFKFNDQTYNQFFVYEDGFIGFGSTPVPVGFPYDNSLTNSIVYPLIMPWGEDLFTAKNGSIHYKIMGNAGSKKLVIEWNVNNCCRAQPFNKKFQLWLFEGSNKIEFVYGAGVFDMFTAASIGMASSTTNFLSVNTDDQNVSSSISKNNNNIWPGAGRSYRFSPNTAPVVVPVASIAATTSTVFCAGNNVTLNASLTNADALTYQWYKGSSAIDGATNSSFTANEGGDYHVAITYANGSSTSAPVIITVNALPIFTTEVINVNCNNANNGSIQIKNIAFNAPYNFHLMKEDGTAHQQANDQGYFATLADGAYKITVTDVNLCAASKNIAITQPAPINVASRSITNVSCSGQNDGSLSVGNITGGNGAYTINWTGPNDYNGQGNTITNLRGGSYYYSINDGNNCAAATGEYTVAEPEAVVLNVTSTNITKNAANDGHIIVSTNGIYEIKDASGKVYSNNTANYGPGTYTITSSLKGGNEGNICAATPVTVEITEPSVVSVPTAVTTAKNVTCYGGYDGSASVEVKNSTATYSYFWLNNYSLVSYTATANNLPAGSYTVLVYDKSKLFYTGKVTVSQPAPLVVQASITSNYNGVHVSCATATNGSVKLVGKGGSNTYTYTLYNSNFRTTNTEGNFSNLSAGTYFYSVKDSKGCNPVYGSLKLIAPTTIDASVSMYPSYPVFGQDKHTIYLGYGTQAVQLNTTVSGGTKAVRGYSYAWSPSIGLNSTTAANPTATPTTTTTYKVVITDANGCATTKSITVNVVDVRYNGRILICYFGRTYSVEARYIPELLNKGISLGSCASISITGTTWDLSENAVSGELAIDAIEAFDVTGLDKQIPVVKAGLNVYPNPSRGAITVQIGNFNGAKATVIISDLNGKEVARQIIQAGQQKVNFNLQNTATGIYLVKVLSENSVQTSKVMIQH